MSNFGDWSPEGSEIRAMRIDYGPGYRLYYTIRNGRIVILLCGGDKRTHPKYLIHALETAARARGMLNTAKEADVELITPAHSSVAAI